MALASGLLLGVVFVSFGGLIVRLFVGSEADLVVRLASQFLHVNGSFYALLGVLFVFRGALQGLGNTLVPSLSGLIELVMRVCAAIVLGAEFGFGGVVWGNPLAWAGAVVVVVPAWVRARRGLEFS
jgi:Na+-driven multidrug efflux pump